MAGVRIVVSERYLSKGARIELPTTASTQEPLDTSQTLAYVMALTRTKPDVSVNSRKVERYLVPMLRADIAPARNDLGETNASSSVS